MSVGSLRLWLLNPAANMPWRGTPPPRPVLAGSRGRLHETGWFKEGTVKDINKMSGSES